MRPKVLFNFLIVLLSCNLYGQAGGLRSPDTELYFIESDTARIIYEKGKYPDAARVLSLFHKMARAYPIAGNDKLRKISVILQNSTDVPNGYVGLAPWRSEFFISAPPNSFELGSMPWTDLLAIHEFRHVQQRSAARRGITRVVYWLMGEQAFSVATNLSWPRWYSEGDAVIAETALSDQGRGRLPYFLNGYREMVLHSGKIWSYAKARNGSFKDFVPSEYHLGFLMMDYGRRIAGQSMWDSVSLEAVRYQGLFYPFSRNLKRHTGMTTTSMYASMLDYYKNTWSQELYGDSVSGVFAGQTPSYVDYSYPVFDSSGNLFVIESAFDRVESIVRKTTGGKSEKVVLMGYAIDPAISIGGGRLCWAERRLHPRWVREDNTALVILDLETGRKRVVARGESFFSPALSKDGGMIAVVCDNGFQEYSLRILNSESGDVVSILPNPGRYYITYPAWSGDGEGIVSSVRNADGQMAIIIQDIETGDIIPLTDWLDSPIGRVSVWGNWVYFSASDRLTDQLFRVSQDGGPVYQLTESRFSNYDPVVNPQNGDLYFTQFTLWGRRLRFLPAGEITKDAVSQPAAATFRIENGEGKIEPDSLTEEESRYGLFRNAINIHSWNPFYEDPVLSMDVLAENVLGSVFWNTGMRYNLNSRDYGPYSQLTLSMWYPEIQAGYSGWSRTRTGSDGKDVRYFQHDIYAGVRIPLKGMHGAYDYAGSITSNYNYSLYRGDFNFDFNYLFNRLVFRHQLRRAYQHPMSRFAQAVDIRFNNAIDTTSGLQFQVQSDFTFPGIMPNHVLWLQADYRFEPTDNFISFSDQFSYPRGYDAFRSDWVYRLGINYHLPVFYPDVGVFGMVYFKRIRLNAFLDYCKAGQDVVRREFNSAGLECILDMNLANVQPFSLGFRYARLFNEDLSDPLLKDVFEVFLPVLRF